jgi:hypothetical protein
MILRTGFFIVAALREDARPREREHLGSVFAQRRASREALRRRIDAPVLEHVVREGSRVIPLYAADAPDPVMDIPAPRLLDLTAAAEERIVRPHGRPEL